jgi:disulfide bond formation protein DsbB
MLSIRRYCVLLFTLCSFFIAGAYWFQFFHNALPCSLCVIERFVLVSLALSFLACAIQQPAYKTKSIAVYTVLHSLLVLIGLAASARHLWLQNQPFGQDNRCIPLLPPVVHQPWVFNIINSLGTHQCAEAGPYFLGFSLSVWVFLLFIILGILISITPFLAAFRK